VSTSSPAGIPIEERDESEVLGAWGRTRSGRREFVRVANPSSLAFNSGFDVAPPELIEGILTPVGIFKPGELWAKRRLLGGPE
jgi:methylthioribose-1-phosphate isomerase